MDHKSEKAATVAAAISKSGRADRAFTKCLSAHVPEAMYWEVKSLSVEKRTDMQNILAEAVNDLLTKNHRPRFSVREKPTT